MNDKLREEVGQCKDEIWSQKLKLDECNKNIKGLEETLYKERESAKGILNKLSQKEE